MAGENELLKEKGLESGLVNIGASETALRLILLTELESFHHQYPHVKLRISNHSTPQAIQALENGLVDFAVITTPIALKKPLQRIPLFSFREILLGGPEFADIASTPHHLADLQDIPLVGIGPGTSTHELFPGGSGCRTYCHGKSCTDPSSGSFARTKDLSDPQCKASPEYCRPLPGRAPYLTP